MTEIGGFLLTLALALGAVARVTRLIADDRITQAFRDVVARAANRRSTSAHSSRLWMVHYLLTCDWCASLWVAAAIVPAAVLTTGRTHAVVIAFCAAATVAYIYPALAIGYRILAAREESPHSPTSTEHHH